MANGKGKGKADRSNDNTSNNPKSNSSSRNIKKGKSNQTDGGDHANDHNDEQEEEEDNERTPLLNRNRQDGNDGGQHSEESDDNDNDSDSDNESEESQDSIVSNLGDFSIQPRDLANCLSEKDVNALLELGGSSSSSSSSKAQSKDGRSPSSQSIKSLLEALQTDPEKGLSDDQYSENGSQERIRVYGKNKLPEREVKSFWRFLWEAFCDKVLIILTVAAAISFALGMWQDFGPQHDPDEPRVNWVEGVAISESSLFRSVSSSHSRKQYQLMLVFDSDRYRHRHRHVFRK